MWLGWNKKLCLSHFDSDVHGICKNVLYEMGPRGSNNWIKLLFLDINQTSILFEKENTKGLEPGSEGLCVCSFRKRHHWQLGFGSPWTFSTKFLQSPHGRIILHPLNSNFIAITFIQYMKQAKWKNKSHKNELLIIFHVITQ